MKFALRISKLGMRLIFVKSMMSLPFSLDMGLG